MLITKFNKLIRNRMLWGAFAVVVCVSFVFAGARGCSTPERQGLGMLFGEQVSRETYLAARFFELGLGARGNVPQEDEELVRRRTWRRLAQLHTAAELGLGATQDEIAEVLQREPGFRVNGAFNKERYRQIILGRLGIPLDTYEDYLRQDITLRKLAGIMQSLTWITPTELIHRLDRLTDRMQLTCAKAMLEEHRPEVSITEEDALAFYEENEDLFREPERVSVRYVRFPVSNFIAQVKGEVTDTDIQQYYDDHVEEFMTTDTNDTVVALPLDDVRESIRSNLVQIAAGAAAKWTASEFSVSLATDKYGQSLSLAQAAATNNVQIHTSGLFAVSENVSGPDVGFRFKNEAFNLDPDDPDGYTSGAIEEEDAFYVLATDRREGAYLPAFSNIVDKVMPPALSNAVFDAFVENLETVRSNAIASLAADTNAAFTALMQANGLTTFTTETFTVYEGMSSNDEAYADFLMPHILSLQEGEITEPIPMLEDAALLAYCNERIPGEPGLVEFLRPELLRTLNGYRAGMIFEDWAEGLLAEGQLVDYTETASDEEDEEPEDEPDL